MVLERFSDAIIRQVTGPLTGIQRRSKFPPSIAEIVAECEHESERQARIAELATLRAVPRGEHMPQHRANVFVPSHAPQYAAMLEKAKTGDKQEWRLDAGRVGIWVALGWIKPSMAGSNGS